MTIDPEGALAAGRGPVISRESPVPLHHQFRAYLVAQIERGELAPGQQLLQEREYAAQLGVSLAPVRQALLDLVKEGYLYRVRGKGTFVREHKVEEKISILSSFTESMRAKGLDAEVRLIRQELVSASRDLRAALATRERRVLLIERLALLDAVPLALLAAYLSPAMFPSLAEAPLGTGSLYATLGERYGVEVERAENTIEVVRCQPEQAALLGLAPGAPALQVVGVTYDQRDRPVEFSRVLYQADRFRFTLSSFRLTDRVMHLIDAREARRGRRSPR
jgi:GntR family transcriptional regulator